MYRRRRLAVLLVLLVVIAVIWLLIAHPWAAAAPVKAVRSGPAEPVLPVVTSSAQPAGAPTATPGATTTPTATPSPGATTVPDATATPRPQASARPCAAHAVTVTAVTDRKTYTTGEDPQLSIRLTNTGAECTLNVGSAAQVFTVSSGGDVWWRSTDCQSGATNAVVTIKAGQTVTSSRPVVWDRTRSSVATCQAKNRPTAPAGGATYHLSVSIGGIASASDATFMLR